jgi:hypothetical protein
MATLRSTLEQVKRQFHEFLTPTMILHVCQEESGVREEFGVRHSIAL